MSSAVWIGLFFLGFLVFGVLVIDLALNGRAASWKRRRKR